MVVRTRRILSRSAPKNTRINAPAKRSVWIIIDHMDPTPRVTERARDSRWLRGVFIVSRFYLVTFRRLLKSDWQIFALFSNLFDIFQLYHESGRIEEWQ